jgi:hypothetical protein
MTTETLYCVMCGETMSEERKKKRSITCSDSCAKERTRYLHRRVARKKCRYCMQPATPDEIKLFKAWRKSEAGKLAAEAPSEGANDGDGL